MNKFYTLILSIALGAGMASGAALDGMRFFEPAAISPVQRTAAATPAKSPAKAETAAHDWKSIGVGVFTDDVLTSVIADYTPLSYNVPIEQDANNPGYYRFKMYANHPYAESLAMIMVDGGLDSYIVVNASDPTNVIIEPSNIGFTMGNEIEEAFLCSLSWYPDFTVDELASRGLLGTLDDDVIAFTGVNALWITSPSLDVEGMGYRANKNGAFKLALPGHKDYSLEIMTSSWCAYEGRAILGAWGGTDLAEVKAVAVLNPDDAAAELAKPGAQSVTSQGAYINLPEGAAPLQPIYIVAEGYDAAGTPRASATTYIYADDNSTTWATLDGDAVLYDYTVHHAYGLTPYPVKLAVQESTVTPGIYRLVNPFANTAYNTLTPSVHGNHNHYMYLDASDPECVVLLEGPTGFITDLDGDCRLSSRASYAISQGMSKADVKARGWGGKMVNGKITFPFDAYIYIGFLVEGPDFWMNVNFTSSAAGYAAGPMYVDLSDALGICDVTTDDLTPAVYYNLQGIEIPAPAPGQIVIERRGDKIVKKVF